MMSTTNNGSPTDLQEQCRLLQQALDAKQEALFELESSLAVIEAEKIYEIRKVQAQGKDETKKLQEALRRSEREATRLHHELSRTVTTAVVTPAVTNSSNNTIAAATVAAAESNTTTSNDNTSTTTTNDTINHQQQTLALHLLQTASCHSEPPPDFLLTTSTNDSNVVWQLMEHCLSHDTKWTWLQEALTWSASSRRMVVRACCSSSSTAKSSTTKCRISCHTISREQLEAAQASLREPLQGTFIQSDERPYLRDLAHRLLHRLSSHALQAQSLHILVVLLSDASAAERKSLAWQPFCATPESPIPTLLQQWCRACCLPDDKKRRVDYAASNDMITPRIRRHHRRSP